MDFEDFEEKFLGKEEKRRKDRDDYKIMHEVFDSFTIDTILKLANKKEIDRLKGVVNTGKEANVFLAYTKDLNKRAVKIYRFETSDFNAMWKYLEGDKRFEKVKKKKRSIIFAWCQKEFSNLALAKKSGVRVPRPYRALNNVLVMQFVDGPLLKDIKLENPKEVFEDLVEQMRKLYKAKLVHGDLSEFNIIWYRNKPYLIDIGQAVLLSHPRAQEFLERDVRNVCNYFKKLKVKCNEKEVLKEVMSN